VLLERSNTSHASEIDFSRLHSEYCKGLYETELTRADFSKEHYDKLLETKIIAYCSYFGLDPKLPGYIKLPGGKYDEYYYYLSMSLVFYDKFKIRVYLDYQLEHFNGDKREFIEIIIHTIVGLTEKNSPFDNTDRLDRIMKWAEDKKNKINARKDNVITNSDITLNWLIKDTTSLNELSNRLFLSEYTSNPKAFKFVFIENKKTKWKGEPEYLIYLLYRLIKNHKFKARHGKGHLKAAVKYFYDEDSEILAKENKIHHILSKVRIKQLKTYAATRRKVDTLLNNELNIPLPDVEVGENSQ